MNAITEAEYFKRRREPFLDEASYNEATSFIQDEAIPQQIQALETGGVDEENIGYALHHLGSDYLDIALLRYSGGRPVEEMREPLLAAITQFDKNLASKAPAIVYVDLAIQTYYVEALSLLSLARLLGLGDEQVLRIANLYSADETNDGADELFETLLAKLGRTNYPADALIHEDPYQLLLDCIKADPAQRPALMTQFLKRWFKGQKDCDWWGSHVPRKGTKVLDTGFTGYWAFEAALVTVLWDIDDSSYRDLPHYPRDLADFARANATSTEDQPQGGRVASGEPCPRTGYWLTPAKADSRRHFQVGELMPELQSAYGATIWQWDEQQAD